MSKDDSGFNRRQLLKRGGQVAAGTGLLWFAEALTASGSADAAPMTTAGGATRSVTVSEGTNFCAVLSPDGRTLVLDLFAVLWLVPVGGGPATRLTTEIQDTTLPHWSPDGKHLVFQSFQGGNYQLWSIGADGNNLRQLTDGPYDYQEPRFSPDGSRIVFACDRDDSNAIWTLDVATGAITRITTATHRETMPTWSPDGGRIAFAVDETSIDVLDLATGARSTAVVAPAGATLYGPAFTPDGAGLSYVRYTGTASDLVVGEQAITSGEDVFGFALSWASANEVLYTADGRIRRRALGDAVGAVPPSDVPFTATLPIATRDYVRQVRDITSLAPQAVRGIASPVLSPDGNSIAFRALNALWLMPVGGKPRAVVSDGYFNADPDFSPDGSGFVYASDRSGTANLWHYDLADGTSRQLTDVPRGALTPRWSPDGTGIAYQDADGALWVLTIADGSVRQVLPALFQPGRPTWSPDGSVLAIAAVKPFSLRNKSGFNQVLTIDLGTGATNYAEPAPFRSIATRGDDGPLWTPDGRNLILVMESVAWALPVDTTGKARGPARQLTTEVTDALSIGNNGETLLYLSNGTLRTIALAGGTPRTVPMALTYQRLSTPGRTILRAGAVWDGRATALREDMDIVVEGGRITDVVPRGSVRGDRLVDASGLTAMPGLIDMHTHWFMRGRGWGDRQGRLWLSYGVTTTRSPGDPAYQMLETREAFEAGAKVGPRFFGTGEALDGTRILYDVMRPVQSADQLTLELSRAVALGYDLMKGYIRLSAELAETMVSAAHALGIPATSHYIYPAAAGGMDAMEHVGGGNRLGYTHTVSRLGRTSDGVVEMLAKGGMPVTPTVIYASLLYAQDQSLLEDPRTKVLFPVWEYQLVQRLAAQAVGPLADTIRTLLAGAVDMLKRVQDAGGLLVAGTDAPLDTPALAMHLNLRSMVQYGFTPYEVLVGATGNSAQVLGRGGELGAVLPGYLADLVFVQGNPLADITAAAAVRMAMVGGQVHTVDELLDPFRAPAAATGVANVVTPALTGVHADFSHSWHRPGFTEAFCNCH